MKLVRVLALMAAFGLTAATAQAEDMIIVNFDEFELADCAAFGVTFSENCQIVTAEDPCSVYDDPNCPVASGDSALCVGECGGEVGYIWFDKPHTFVGMVALSGGGADTISPGMVMRAFDCDDNLIEEVVADSDLQFDFVAIPAAGIYRIELFSPDVLDDGWDDFCFIPSPCPADLNGDSMIELFDLMFIFDKWGTADAAADINDDGTVDILDFLHVVWNWGYCDQFPGG